MKRTIGISSELRRKANERKRGSEEDDRYFVGASTKDKHFEK